MAQTRILLELADLQPLLDSAVNELGLKMPKDITLRCVEINKEQHPVRVELRWMTGQLKGDDDTVYEYVPHKAKDLPPVPEVEPPKAKTKKIKPKAEPTSVGHGYVDEE